MKKSTLIKLIPIDQTHQQLISSWLLEDVAGKRELSSYNDLQSWLKLLNPVTRWGWIVYENEIPIGFLDLEKLSSKGYFSFYLEPQQRGKGKSALLLNAVISEARKLKLQQLEAGAEELNIASQKALQAMGFSEIGRDKDNYRVFTINI